MLGQPQSYCNTIEVNAYAFKQGILIIDAWQLKSMVMPLNKASSEYVELMVILAFWFVYWRFMLVCIATWEEMQLPYFW